MSPDASRQSIVKMTNRPHFAHIQGAFGAERKIVPKCLFLLGNAMTIQFWNSKFDCRDMLLSLRRLPSEMVEKSCCPWSRLWTTAASYCHGFSVPNSGSRLQRNPFKAKKETLEESLSVSELQSHPNLHSPVFFWVGSNRGRPQRGGTNLGVFVPMWLVMRMPG